MQLLTVLGAGAILGFGALACLALGVGLAAFEERASATAPPAASRPAPRPRAAAVQGDRGQSGLVDATDPDPGEVTAANEEAALEAMRARYRPGPFVELEGMLPNGRLKLARAAHAARLWRAGRTIDNPWIVAGAQIREGAAPTPSAAAASVASPHIEHGAHERAGRMLTILPGVPSRIGVHTSRADAQDGDVRAFYIAFDGYNGHFELPAGVETELGRVAVAGVTDGTIHFAIDSAIMPGGALRTEGAPFEVTMRVAAVDVAGRVSSYVTRRLSIVPVGAGDVEVSLSMSEATDLDLYVTDPGGVVVYYGNTSSGTGGRLDLDANAACSSNLGVTAEHVFWQRGRAPAGTYTVRVSNFESCISGRPVDYRITVRNCGETAVLSGSFRGNGNTETCTHDPGTNRSWCQNVVSFDVTPCKDEP